MIKRVTPQQYVYLLKARLGTCAAVDPRDRHLPSIRDDRGSCYLIGRGGDVTKKLLCHDPLAAQPLRLVAEGEIRLYVRVRPSGKYCSQVTSYRLAVLNLPDNRYHIKSLRYDWSAGQEKGEGWDPDLEDNPKHPQGHLHVNFLPPGDPDCRLPTSPVCPILLLRAFDHWYCSTFHVS